MIRLSNQDDLREDLELSVLELRHLGVPARSIRRYVNASIRAFEAGEGSDGYVASAWLRKRWKREQDPSEDPSPLSETPADRART